MSNVGQVFLVVNMFDEFVMGVDCLPDVGGVSEVVSNHGTNGSSVEV